MSYNQRSVIRKTPQTIQMATSPLVGEKRPHDLHSPSPNPNKKQKTSPTGYSKLFNSNNVSEEKNQSHSISPKSNIKNQLPFKAPPLPVTPPNSPNRPNVTLPSSPLHLKQSIAANNQKKLLKRSPSPQSQNETVLSSPDSSPIKEDNINLKNDLKVLKKRLDNLESTSVVSLQQQTIEFLQTQLKESEKERRKQNEQMWSHSKELTEERRDFFSTIKQKDTELKQAFSLKKPTNHLSPIPLPKPSIKRVSFPAIEAAPTTPSPLLSPSSDSENEEFCSSQESLQALCRTQIRKKKKDTALSPSTPTTPLSSKQHVDENSESILNNVQVKLDMIVDLLKKQEKESLINKSKVKEVVSDPIQNTNIQELLKKIKRLESEVLFQKNQCEMKDKQKQGIMDQCKSLSIEIEQLKESKEILKKKSKITEKKLEDKYTSMKNLAVELKLHIESQQNEIQNLKVRIKQSQENIIQKDSRKENIDNVIVKKSIQQKPTVQAQPKPIVLQKKSIPQIEEQVPIVRKEKVKPIIEEIEYDIEETVDEPMNLDDTRNTDEQMKDTEDDIDSSTPEGAEPILSVEQYAAESYASHNEEVEPFDDYEVEEEEKIEMKRTIKKHVSFKSNNIPKPIEIEDDDSNLSLSQEMDSILGMSQYNPVKPSCVMPYQFSASPLNDPNADPYLRESTTLNALAHVEQISSQ